MILMTLAFASGPTDAVTAFVRAGDENNTRKLETVLHPKFRVVARMPDGVSVMDRSVYVGLVKSKKIGGEARTTDVDLVMQDGDLATVRGRLESKTAVFESTWTVVREDGTWRVLQDMVVYTPR